MKQFEFVKNKNVSLYVKVSKNSCYINVIAESSDEKINIFISK